MTRITTMSEMLYERNEAFRRIEELEAELKWLQREHVRVCSSESALREVANLAIDLVEDYTVTDKRLVAAVAKLLEDT